MKRIPASLYLLPGRCVAGLMLCLLVVVAANCGHRTTQSTEKTLHFAVSYPFNGDFDPVNNNYISLAPLFRGIYSPLFRLDDQLGPSPFLLRTYEKKGRTLVFYIRDDADFSDGSPITSVDVIRSIEAAMSLSPYPNSVYKLIEGGEDFLRRKTPHCSGIRSLGPKTLEIKLKNEHAPFAHYFSADITAILPGHRNRDRGPAESAFSGMFRVTDLHREKTRTRVTLERNPRFRGKRSNLHRLIIDFYHDMADFDTAIRDGVPDLFFYNRHYRLPNYHHRYNVFKTPALGGFYFKLNARRGPFRDKKLRTFFKQFILSLDLGRDQAWELNAPSPLVLPYGLTGYSLFSRMTGPVEFAPAVPARPITLHSVNPRHGIREALLPLLKEKLRAHNIDLQLEWKPLDQVMEMEKRGEPDLTSYYYLVDIPLAFYFYETLFTPGHELNLFGHEIPGAKKLLEEYGREQDEFKRLRILSRLEQLAQDEAVLIPVMNPLYLLGYKNDLTNVKIDTFLNIPFEDIDVKKRN